MKRLKSQNITIDVFLLPLLLIAGCGGGDDALNLSLPSPPLLFETTDGLVIKNNIKNNYSNCILKKSGDENIMIKIIKNKDILINNYLSNDNYYFNCVNENGNFVDSRPSNLSQFSIIDLGYSGPISIEDFNGDKFYEVFGSLYQDFRFEKLNVHDIGFDRLELSRVSRDIRFADLDNDGNLDAVANIYSENINLSNNYIQLYWGKDGKFVLDEEFAKKKYTGYGETIVVSDLDNDNFLDIFIPQYKVSGSANEYSRNLLFKNLQTRAFDEVAMSAGVVNSKQSYPEAAQALDFNSDSFIDLYAGGSLFINNKNFTFTDFTDALRLPGTFDEGAKFFDYDLDGDFDFITNSTVAAPKIFINNEQVFDSASQNIFPTDFYLYTYGLQLADYNGDGYEDLLLGGGVDKFGNNTEPRFYLQLNGKYVRQSLFANNGAWSDLVGFADFDSNGSFDMVVRYGNLKIVTNQHTPRSFVKIDVVYNNINNQQGRSIKIYYPDGKIKIQSVDGGSGYMSNLPYTLNIPNEMDNNLLFEIFCKDKIKKIKVSNGYHKVDCAA